MAENNVPESVVKAAKDLQVAFRQGRDLKMEIKEKQEALKRTEEWAAVEDAKKVIKEFEAANEQYKAAKAELKEKRAVLRETKAYQELKEARKLRKEYTESIIDVARNIAKDLTGTTPADLDEDL